ASCRDDNIVESYHLQQSKESWCSEKSRISQTVRLASESNRRGGCCHRRKPMLDQAFLEYQFEAQLNVARTAGSDHRICCSYIRCGAGATKLARRTGIHVTKC